ncbi:hypothetical protein [Phenylobacterium sp.]|jgi:hypothetical protein|uniref:hypothetical protein n=1 Tax=Phenylobacterium sp. TaxID=1871053 RepID=UPI002F3FA1EF
MNPFAATALLLLMFSISVWAGANLKRQNYLGKVWGCRAMLVSHVALRFLIVAAIVGIWAVKP